MSSYFHLHKTRIAKRSELNRLPIWIYIQYYCDPEQIQSNKVTRHYTASRLKLTSVRTNRLSTNRSKADDDDYIRVHTHGITFLMIDSWSTSANDPNCTLNNKFCRRDQIYIKWSHLASQLAQNTSTELGAKTASISPLANHLVFLSRWLVTALGYYRWIIAEALCWHAPRSAR